MKCHSVIYPNGKLLSNLGPLYYAIWKISACANCVCSCVTCVTVKYIMPSGKKAVIASLCLHMKLRFSETSDGSGSCLQLVCISQVTLRCQDVFRAVVAILKSPCGIENHSFRMCLSINVQKNPKTCEIHIPFCIIMAACPHNSITRCDQVAGWPEKSWKASRGFTQLKCLYPTSNKGSFQWVGKCDPSCVHLLEVIHPS